MVVLYTNRFAALNPGESPHPHLLAQQFHLLQPLPQLGKQGACLAHFKHWFKSSMAHHIETLSQ
jgi:hypothetical protein